MMKVRRNRLSRYLFRRDLLRKVRARAAHAYRRLSKDEIADQRRLLGRDAPGVVFDVGSHVGYVAAAYLKAFPRAVVHCFEPTPATLERLRAHLGAHPRARIHGIALSDVEGEVDLHVDNRTFAGGANSLLSHTESFRAAHPGSHYEAVRVACSTLDATARRLGVHAIDVCKLDVEGAELRVLAGAEDLLAAGAIDVLQAEVRVVADFEGQPLLEDVVAHLRRRDYPLFNLYPFAESARGQALFGNAVFLGPRLRERLALP